MTALEGEDSAGQEVLVVFKEIQHPALNPALCAGPTPAPRITPAEYAYTNEGTVRDIARAGAVCGHKAAAPEAWRLQPTEIRIQSFRHLVGRLSWK